MKWTCGNCKYEGQPSDFMYVRARIHFEGDKKGFLSFTTECPKCHMHYDIELKLKEGV